MYLLAPNKGKQELDEEETDDAKIIKKRQKDRDGKDKFKDLGNMIKNTQAVQDWILAGNK